MKSFLKIFVGGVGIGVGAMGTLLICTTIRGAIALKRLKKMDLSYND